MIVSLEWLKKYVDINVGHDELVDKLTMSGLNHEGTESVGGDQAIDLEVTSNRADCNGHIGVAREIAALFGGQLKVPDPQPTCTGKPIEDLCRVEITCPDLCYRYTARLIQGVKVGPSPDWLVDHLETIGVKSVNNIVDITNYVLFECGQPLHAFDFAKLAGGKVIVREPNSDEKIEAIDHSTYELKPGTCVIADAEKAVCVGGVMGGVDSEVSDSTTDVLIEAAYFSPMAVRSTARQLKLHSPSSFRFERDIDSHNLDWASRRCCELILQIAGGELCEGFIDEGQLPSEIAPVTLRYPRIKRILGIEIPKDNVPSILESLGLKVSADSADSITVVPPSWRKDLTREVDLIEEVGRIYGYDQVPDTVAVPMVASHRPESDRVMDKVRLMMTGAGFDEAMTATMVPGVWSEAFSPWTTADPIVVSQPMLGVLEQGSHNIGAVNLIRRSLVPSLLEVKRINDYRSNQEVELFETAKVYLAESTTELPREPLLLGIVSSRGYPAVKGVVEAIVQRVNPECQVEVVEFSDPLFNVNYSSQLKVNGEVLGYIGEVSEDGLKQFKIRSGAATVAEIDLGVLEQLAVHITVHKDQSKYQAISRDFNFIVEDRVHWQDLESTVHTAGGELCEVIQYRETFRDEKKDGAGKKRLLMSVTLRSSTETLSGDQADEVCQNIIAACKKKHSAELVA
jgi:phenylalanyl-tRNA synthetase beta chain